MAIHSPRTKPTERAKSDQLGPGLHYRIAMQAPEFGNALVVGTESSQHPHHFDVALTLSFQKTGRTNLLQISV